MTSAPSQDTLPPEVRFETRETTHGRRIGFAHLARPRQMNALTAAMCEAMLAQFADWASDESIACVVLDGEGERAFCAGGDVVSIVRPIREGGPRRHVPGDRLFTAEYRLVRAIFEHAKPFVAWMHGVTMGAGLGLAMAASHRVVSPNARVAMPESRIGLFPDVGATWFLGRAPDNAGPLVALAGLVLDAADAADLGIAEWIVDEAAREATYATLLAAPLTGEAVADASTIARVLADAAGEGSPAPGSGPLRARRDAIRRIGQARRPEDLRAAVAEEAARDAWFADALAALDAGAPLSIRVGFEHFRRSRGKSLAEVLATDLVLAKAFVRGDDLAEGVRAALIDKDRRPQWSARSLADVAPSTVAALFDGA